MLAQDYLTLKVNGSNNFFWQLLEYTGRGIVTSSSSTSFSYPWIRCVQVLFFFVTILP